MKMSEKIQAIDEIFLSTSNQEKFLDNYGFEALKKIQAKLNSLIENQEERYKRLAEEEAERVRLAEEEAKAKIEEQIEALKPFAKLQLPQDKQTDESAIRAKAEKLLATMSEPQSVEESDSKPKAKRSYNAVQFKTLLTDSDGNNIVRSLTGRRSPEVKALIGDEPIWKLVHEDDSKKFIAYAENHITYKKDIESIKAHFKK
ncbi:hypothetical protein Q6U54_002160 [Vibrio vulnificus]|uniref:hypothetical protein n=1 Tax=Vibrio jasicida TaxID=766224 RepID=UPI0005EE11B1|nr:hypothetical protein [Vibrio jasicida]ELL0596564.1 hypothetical protein [Vibrio vulnificus]